MFFNMRLGEEFRTLATLQRLAIEGTTYSWMILKVSQELQIVLSKGKILGDTVRLLGDALLLFHELELTGLTGGYNNIVKQLIKGEIHTSHFHLTDILIQWHDLTDFVNAVLQANIPQLTITDMALLKLPFNDTYVSKHIGCEVHYFETCDVVSMAVLETPIIHMTCPMSQSPLRQLDFSNCAMADTIFSRVEGEHILECETFGQLNQLFLRGNNLKDFQVLSTRVQYMTSLEYLDLSLNYLTHDSQAECAWPPSLIHVNLSSNRLTHSVFSCLPRGTKVLDLQNNQVSVVPQGPFLRLDSLAILDLSSNRLRDLPEFQESWNQVLNRKMWGYRCSYPEALRNSTLKDFWIPEVSCNVGLLAVTILGPTFIIIIAVTTCCHRLDIPWYLSMIWQWAMVKYRAKTNNDQLQDMLGVEFHAFVSYSQQDAEWVNDSLLPNLQGPAGGGLHICHHEESFLPGKTIIENIMHCVEKSWRCVFVLSSHFVKSDWCNYELYFASQQHLSWGSDRVVLLLLEPVPQYLIPSKFHQLKLLMSKHTYLEWPQEKAKHRLFCPTSELHYKIDLRNAPPARPLDVDDVTTSTPSCQRSTATAY
ncbi:Toll-like receptor 1 [Merluccius polli]|uniref:Toll-like receptor 1 n=1 Tax=Merluccius polli TaxID=89951 RepID=A0AA47NQL7_MERPO|nr:Toll-like receptor 1 [Merluccius polli]